MNTPSWHDPKLGTMKRAALWLVSEVGEGNVFTKGQLRDAFPNIAQIDRRMRDLRSHGWRIDTNREDLTLNSNEQRFVLQGEPVWEPGKTKAQMTITANQRRELMQRDHHMCRSCGISGGQTYVGSYEAAQLDIARRSVRRPDGSEQIQLVTECNRCRIGGRGTEANLGNLLNRVGKLSDLERKILASWIAADRRDFSELEQLWADYRTLPADARQSVEQAAGPQQERKI